MIKDGRWTVADRLLGAALEREPHERAAFLNGACGGDEALRRDVESLLAHERDAGDFLVHPALDLARPAPSSARPSLSVDRELGPYRILSWLGSGGMGDVYLARDTRLKRHVALKILPDSFATDPGRLARFQREAQILASLNHPHIASIHGVEENDGTRALVLEFVAGETLADRIARGPIAVNEALPIARQITDALHSAHEQGVIHRDLKPANVKVTPAGIVKVLDFGLAKAMPGDGGTAGPPPVPSGTDDPSRDGSLVGTAAYMSPEQARGQPVDRRSDIWAFGCVLYEMLAGRAAFARSTIPDTLAGVLGAEPEWNDLPPTTPPPIRRLVQRCLDKRLARRLHDIADARIEIDDALESPQTLAALSEERHTVGGPAGVRTWSRAALGLGAVAVVITGLGLMVRDFMRPPVMPPTGETVRFAIHLQPGEQLSIDTGLPVIVATSPDGNQIVYAARGEGGDRLYRRRRGDLEASPIPGTEGAIGPFFSPDGQWIGFASGGMLRAVPVVGGGPRALAESANLIGASWGPRDTIVYGNWDSGLVKVSGLGGRPEVLTTPDEQQGEFQHSAPDVLPDGTAALFTVNRRSRPQLVEVVELATGQRRSLIEGRNPIYLSSGQIMFARGSSLFAAPFDVSSRQVTGPAIRLLDGIQVDGNDTHFAAARDGTLVYVPELSRESRLVWYGREGGSRPLDTQRRRYTHPRISPDGTRVVLNVPRESGELEIWIYDAARGSRTRLSPTGSRPIWSADGQSVTFQMDGSLYSVPADDSGKPQLVLAREDRFSGLYPLAWSRNGRVLMFSAPARATNRDVWMLPDGGAMTPFLVTPRDERAAMFSPDGRWVVYAARETGREEQVYVQPYPGAGGRVLISPDGGIEPVWSPTGREIFYRSSDGTRIMSVAVRTEPTLTIGDSRVLFAGRFTSSDGSYWSNYDVSRDGREFVMLEADQASTPRLNVVLGPTR